ncbi:MAG: folylpolyglutamate synthase/dihydrofolate synthase family protein, partial [Myxococcota bacterium]
RVTSYRDAVGYLYGLKKRGVRLDLERMKQAVRFRGHPERAVPAIQIAGTNGKGSVSAMIAAIGRAAGVRTGLFTSPHLHRFVERIQINGRPIAERTLVRLLNQVRADFDKPGFPELSFYETATLVAFEAFREAECELSVLEVGLGGRLDATSVASPDVALITRVALDHTRILGPDTASIAKEKAAIIQRGRPVVSGVDDPDAAAVVRQVARRKRAPLLWLGRDFDAEGRRIRVGTEHFDVPRLGLRGGHQWKNAACAVAAARALGWDSIDDSAIRRGLANARWPGRLERIAGSPSFLLDAAHNLDAAKALATYLDTQPKKRRTLLFGSLRDKDYRQILRVLEPHRVRAFYAPISLWRGLDPRKLARAVPGTVVRSARDGIARAKRSAGPDGEVIVAGSIFLMAEVRALLRNVRTEPPIAM